MSEKALPRAVNQIQEKLGIKQWTPHDLRRVFAMQLGKKLDADPVLIEKCLGQKCLK